MQPYSRVQRYRSSVQCAWNSKLAIFSGKNWQHPMENYESAWIRCYNRDKAPNFFLFSVTFSLYSTCRRCHISMKAHRSHHQSNTNRISIDIPFLKATLTFIIETHPHTKHTWPSTRKCAEGFQCIKAE